MAKKEEIKRNESRNPRFLGPKDFLTTFFDAIIIILLLNSGNSTRRKLPPTLPHLLPNPH